MNIFILGNGFDLRHNLPTKYINFLHFMKYLKTIRIDYPDKPISRFFEDGELIKSDDDIEKAYNTYVSVYDKVYFDKEDYDFISNNLENCWLEYFISSVKEIETWIDFETEIAFVVSNFKSFFDKAACSSQNEFIVNKFAFIFDEQGNIKDKYTVEQLKGFGKYVINKEKIINELYKKLEEFGNILRLYLKYFVNKPLELIDETLLKKLQQPQFKKVDCVVSFNYTDTFETLYDAKDIFHIHGVIDQSIILGINSDINDELKYFDSTFIKFKKYYQRVSLSTDNRYIQFINFLKESKEDIIMNYNVIVCGHSLDKTDEDVIKDLFDISDRITILYHHESVIGTYIKNLVSIYGKEEFDNVRGMKNMEFVKYEDFETFDFHII